MFGLINKGIEDMVCEQFGEGTWEEIKDTANIDIVSFISMDSYPDEVTHKLITAASKILNISEAAVLEAFGYHWVSFVAAEGYDELMNITGDNLAEFLQNLDNLHGRVGLCFPNLQMPGFQCADVQTEFISLNYYSERLGFTPMVIGIIKGLGKRFDTDIDVYHSASKNSSQSHDSLTIVNKSKCPFKRFLKIGVKSSDFTS
jgi:hypothetical protein